MQQYTNGDKINFHHNAMIARLPIVILQMLHADNEKNTRFG